MIVSDLFDPAKQPEHCSAVTWDPLLEPGALAEGQVLSVRVDAVSGTAGVLLDMRMAISIRESNTGLLFATNVQDLRWKCEDRETNLTAWNIVGSQIEPTASGLRLVVDCAPNATLEIESHAFSYLNANITNLSDTPPDYTEPDIARANIATWSSEIEIISASTRAAAS